MIKKIIISLIVMSGVFLTACATDADIVSQNLSKDADMFRVDRRIVFYNGINGEYMLTIEGRCSLGNNDTNRRLSVTCKVNDGEYKKHFLGLSDNVTFFVEQLNEKKSSESRYKVIFKPSSILPDIDIE